MIKLDRKLRGAVIGFGRMGVTHYAILNTHPRVEFVGVSEDSSFVRGATEKHMRVRVFSDSKKMLQDTAPDFVIIATPTESHGEIATHAIDAGAHVFVEKPFTLSPAEGQRVLSKASASALVNQVGYVLRYNHVILELRRLLVIELALGRPLNFSVSLAGPTVLREPSGWRAKSHSGGGCLYDFASHAVDLIGYLFGPSAANVGTTFQHIHSKNVEDAVNTTFLFADGLRGSLAANWSDPSLRKPTYRIEVFGTEGKIIADLHSLKVFFRDEPKVPGYKRGWNQKHLTELAEPSRFYLRGHEFTSQLDDFIACILENRKPRATFADAYLTDVILERMALDAKGNCN